ncbi:hypothetical protein [Streptomyces niveiscabiei]|uniref:hypothetical protein n=1 Tax=Streptomyces niveiscabiei TaxID=164115 RepID=UPI00389B212A
MDGSRVRAEARPSKRLPRARAKVSWARSSVVCGSPLRWATKRGTSPWSARTKYSAAPASPLRAASARAVAASADVRSPHVAGREEAVT